MSAPTPDPIARATVALAAASWAPSPELRSHYAGVARLALVEARAETARLGDLLDAQEREAVRAGVQLDGGSR